MVESPPSDPPARAPTVATIGYEQTSQSAVLASLVAARVGLLVDVRAIAASRRPGFAKSQLRAGVEAAGIGYLHLRGLGTPKEGRELVRSGRPAAMRPIFEAHLRGAEAQADYAVLRERVAADWGVCLLCLERDPSHCHRAILAEHLARDLGVDILHLHPEPPGVLDQGSGRE